MNTADLLTRARHDARLTQSELANRARTSRPTLSAYEHGRTSPTLETAARLLQRCIYFDTLAHAVVRRRAVRFSIAGAAIRAYCSGWPLTEQLPGAHRERGSLGAGPGPASLEARGDTPEPDSHEHRAGSRPVPGKSRGPGGRAEGGCANPSLSSPAHETRLAYGRPVPPAISAVLRAG